MLAPVVNELKNNWGEQLRHVEFACNSSVRAATSLAPNEVHMGRFPHLPITIFERIGVAGRQSLPRDHLTYHDLATVNTTPSQLLAWNAATQPSPTPCTRFPNSPFSCGCGCTMRLPPCGKARRRTRTPWFSRTSSHSIGQVPNKPSQLAPAPPLTQRTVLLWALSSNIWIYPPTCPARMLDGAFRYNAARPVPTSMTMATCRSICRRD